MKANCCIYVSDSQRYSSGLAYPCNRCGKIYKWRESLSLHKRMECGIEPRFACNICGRKFKHKHHLMKHHNSIHKYNHIFPENLVLLSMWQTIHVAGLIEETSAGRMRERSHLRVPNLRKEIQAQASVAVACQTNSLY
ncbi:Longitudinals lacking protein, isoforms A/B/D/L [Trachymyrmex cornetzi]|uniref:Longitudinals lacking protein, isoforms A/B/D/L n=1 Tax=Trachymyrmex cornetzi TaxID=471704 RepID=A0A195E3X0_9HYME|nr:Longitudinals lacking protein, isoforms A/B/D/L [Trachymyrmex cornetzi]